MDAAGIRPVRAAVECGAEEGAELAHRMAPMIGHEVALTVPW